jgi:predicted hydrocarbon binding protein
MTTKEIGAEKFEEHFWKDHASMTDYFAPAVEALQKYLGVGSKELMFQLGLYLGNKAGTETKASTAKEMLVEFEDVWQKYGVGTLQFPETDPLVLFISDCRICGQLPGTGEMYECAFHEGFFQGALSAKLGKTVSFHQDTNYEGRAGTWCRLLVADTKI